MAPEETAADAEVVCDDVTLTRGGKPVLQRVQLRVMRGETIALVGRSGAGKSSLLKLMNRVLLPDRGRVLVRGKATTEWDPIALRRQTGYVLQETGLFPHLSVRENVAIVPRLLGWPPQRIEQILFLARVGAGRYHDTARPGAELATQGCGARLHGIVQRGLELEAAGYEKLL